MDCTTYNLKQEAMLAMGNLLPAMCKQIRENLRSDEVKKTLIRFRRNLLNVRNYQHYGSRSPCSNVQSNLNTASALRNTII